MDDARVERGLFGDLAFGITRAVPIFVMQLNSRQKWRETLHTLENAPADDRVLLDERKLLGCELAWFLQYGVSDSNLSNVVKQCANPNALDIVGTEFKSGCNCA
jgi:hypothetical protein